MNIGTLSTAVSLIVAVAGGGWWAATTLASKEEVIVAVNKADSATVVTQKLVEDRIKDLRKQKDLAKSPAEVAEIQDKIDAYKEKSKDLEKQLLK